MSAVLDRIGSPRQEVRRAIHAQQDLLRRAACALKRCAAEDERTAHLLASDRGYMRDVLRLQQDAQQAREDAAELLRQERAMDWPGVAA